MVAITVFDKSFLQSLSIDESVWFDHFFYPVITPLFMAETLADLEKKPRGTKSAEDEVAIIAAKTPQMTGGPCYFHLTLAFQNLLGAQVPMNGRIPVAVSRHVKQDGKLGAVVEQPDEAKALSRWQHGHFDDVERLFAKAWRAQIARIDLPAIEAALRRAGVTPQTCKSSQQALQLADRALTVFTENGSRFSSMLAILNFPQHLRKAAKYRWEKLGRPPVAKFAPYAAHVLRVELFFQICVGASLIATTRASHQIDMTYLMYLPFCNIFVSSDKLHRTFAPLFFRPDQSFAWGIDLKQGLAELNTHFMSLPDDVKAAGVMHFATRVPGSCSGLLRQLIEKHAPGLLADQKPIPITEKMNEMLLNHLKTWEEAPEVDQSEAQEDVDNLIIKRSVKGQRGSWIQIAEADRK